MGRSLFFHFYRARDEARVAPDAGNFPTFMKRLLPFIIIALVGLLTVGIAVAVYKAKTGPLPAATTVAASPAPTSAVAAGETPAHPSTPAAAPPAAPEANLPNYVLRQEDDTPHARGPDNAPVTVEIYGDFQCPSCATTSAALGALEKKYDGQLKVIFHQFPLAMHQHAVPAAMAAEAAGVQGHFWEMHDMLYQYQRVWSQSSNPSRFFSAYAKSIGLDVAEFEQDSRSAAIKARVVAEGEAGVTRGVKNTPTLFINGELARNTFTEENLEAAILAALNEKKGS